MMDARDAMHHPEAGPISDAAADASEDSSMDATAMDEDAAPPTDARVIPDAPIRMDGMVIPPEDAATPPDADVSPSFDDAIFMATHNSYSGHERRSIVAQLDRGVRFLEYDIHDNGFTTVGDYVIGHDAPGDEVERGGDNPSDNELRSWLETVARWSRANPGHAPITIGIDVKDDLTDNRNYDAGNIAHLNDILTRVFGSRLYRASSHSGTWPTADALRGRVLAVLSGHRETRELYLRDRAVDPSVAMNDLGRVISVHHSGSGGLWYWTGRYLTDGRVQWRRHGQYDSGTTPAIVLRDDGVLVEVHRSESRNRLFYRVGRLGSNYEITWGPSRDYDDGQRPTLRLLSDGRVHERHQSPSGDRIWEWYGTVNPTTLTVDWRSNARTSGSLFESAVASSTRGRVEVYTGADGGGATDTLLYSTSTMRRQRVRYEQVIFVERQSGDSSVLVSDPLLFFAAGAGSRSAIMDARRSGLVVRAWEFNSRGAATTPPSNFPATDEPHEAWYLSYMRSVGYISF